MGNQEEVRGVDVGEMRGEELKEVWVKEIGCRLYEG